MTAVPGRRLGPVTLRFDPAITTRAGPDAYRGVAAHGPFDNSRVRIGDGSLLFVFPEVMREQARDLFRAVVRGVGNYPGFERMFGVAVDERRAVQHLVVGGGLQDLRSAASAYRSAIEDWGAGGRADLALVVVPHSEQWEVERPYYEAKAALADLGVPSQMVTAELVADERQFPWAVANIALAAFAKLGGVPWTVEAPAGDDDLVLGVGRREVGPEGARRRVFGYAVAFVSNGIYRHTWSVTPTADEDEYADRLRAAVGDALREDTDATPRRVVVHLAKRTGRTEVRAVERALADARVDVPVALLRLDDSAIWDVADTDEDTFAPSKGTVVSLGARRALLQSDGLGATGAPDGPILVEMNSRSTVEPEAFDDLVAQAYRLAHANWRGFNARSKPATLVYGEQLAKLVGHMTDVESWNPARIPVELARKPWFL